MLIEDDNEDWTELNDLYYSLSTFEYVRKFHI